MKIETLISKEELNKRVKELALKIKNDYQGKEINLVCILKGSIFFTCDLAREFDENVKIDFLKVTSYIGKESDKVILEANLLPNIENKDLILVEDIIDTGRTLSFLIPYLKKKNPKSIKVCSLLDKPSRRLTDFKADYVGFTIEDKFVVGYGLDYDQSYRNLPYIGYIKED